MGGEVSTDFKSSNRIEISWLVQVLLNFDWFRGSPRGWMGEGVGERVPPTHMHMHVHACMHTHVYDIIGNSQGFPQWGLPFAIEIIMFNVYMCVHVHVCVCVHVCGGHPNHPPHPSTTPQSCREPKTPKFNNSWTNRDNLILFEDSLPLNIPELI